MDICEKKYKTADLFDQYEGQLQVCEPLFQHYGGITSFSGRITTLKCFEDNTYVRKILDEAGMGRILVIDAGGSLRCAMLGDLLAEKAVQNGWNGIVLYGCVRDVKELEEMNLGIMALASNPRKSIKRGVGDEGHEVTFAGVRFRPGEWLYADRDGIVVLTEKADG